MKAPKCPICGLGTLKKEVGTETFEYKGMTTSVPNYVTYACDACGEAIVDNETLRESGKILKEFQRQVDGLLTGEEIKRIRAKLGLSQTELAEIIGGGLKSVARYETGKVCQSKGMDNLLRILDEYPGALNIIQRRPTAGASQLKGKLIDFTEYKYRVKKTQILADEAYSVEEEGAAYGT